VMTEGQTKTVEKQKGHNLCFTEKPQKRPFGEVALLGAASNPRSMSIVPNNGNLHSYV